jgi:hypothetical protein
VMAPPSASPPRAWIVAGFHSRRQNASKTAGVRVLDLPAAIPEPRASPAGAPYRKRILKAEPNTADIRFNCP